MTSARLCTRIQILKNKSYYFFVTLCVISIIIFHHATCSSEAELVSCFSSSLFLFVKDSSPMAPKNFLRTLKPSNLSKTQKISTQSQSIRNTKQTRKQAQKTLVLQDQAI